MTAQQRQPTSFRLTTDALDLLDKLSEKCGVSKTAVIEILIRERAKKEGVKLEDEPPS